MAEGRQRMEWDLMSSLIAIQVNLNRTKPPWAKPSEFNPFTIKEQEKIQPTLREFASAVIGFLK